MSEIDKEIERRLEEIKNNPAIMKKIIDRLKNTGNHHIADISKVDPSELDIPVDCF